MSGFIGAILHRPDGTSERFPAAFRLVDGRIVSTAEPEERGDCVGCLSRPVFREGFGACCFLGEVVLAGRRYWDCGGRLITACVYRQDNGDPELTARQAVENSVRGTAVPFVSPRASIIADASGGGAGAAKVGAVPAKSPKRVPAGYPSRGVRMEQGSLL